VITWLNSFVRGMVIDQAVKNGFRFRNVDELATKRVGTGEAEKGETVNSLEKDISSVEYFEPR